MNRFSSDMEAVDRQLADLFTAVYQPGFMLISTLLIVCFTVTPFILLYLPVAYYFRKWSNIYKASAREIKRLNSNSRSPVFQSKRCCALVGFLDSPTEPPPAQTSTRR